MGNRDQIDIETEIKLLETKIKNRLAVKGNPTRIKKNIGIDYSQLSNFKAGKRKFSVKRLITIKKILEKSNVL